MPSCGALLALQKAMAAMIQDAQAAEMEQEE